MKTSIMLKNIIKPLISPPVFDFWASKFAGNASWETPLATVVERRVEARDAVTLILRPNRHFDGFAPGQHINVTVDVAGVRQTRSYSLTDVPKKTGLLSITAKRVEGGKVSTELCQHVRVGDVLELGQAYGEMTIPADYQGHWLLLAAGSGITPLMSIVRALTQTNLRHSVTLVYWARTRADLCFFQELRQLSMSQPRFQVHFVLTREPDPLPDDVQGRPSLALFESLLADMETHRAYACGSAGFVRAVQELLSDRVESFSSEAFTPVTPRQTAEGTVSVALTRSQRTLELSVGKTILQGLEEAGVTPPSGCRMGICNTCACGKVSGVTEDVLSGDVSKEAASALRICISAARSDIALDL
jgi:stearoyl-CoA 9-desaturase NADPH oxidoreductase